jgi:hypothetical protein
MFNGVVAGAVGAYVATRSTAVALVAVVLAVALVGWLALLEK